MQKLSKEELTKIALKSGGPKNIEDSPAYPFYKEIDLLMTGEGMLISYTEWPLKQRPAQSSMPNRLTTMERKYRVQNLQDGSGFVVTRIA